MENLQVTLGYANKGLREKSHQQEPQTQI